MSRYTTVPDFDAVFTQIDPPEVNRASKDRPYQKAQIQLIKRQIRVAETLNYVTVWAAIIGGIGILVLVGTLLVTKQSVDTARAQLELSERAWVSVQIDPAGAINPTSKEGGGIQIPLKFSLTDQGSGVAVNVTFNEEIEAIADLQDTEATLGKQRQFCERLRRGYTPYSLQAMTLFPKQQPRTAYMYPVVGWKDIATAETHLLQIDRTAARNLIHPILIGCVNYTYGVAQGSYHQTGFIYYIEPYDPRFPDTPYWINTRQPSTEQWDLRDFEAGEAFYAD